jgi:hypothetical protein
MCVNDVSLSMDTWEEGVFWIRALSAFDSLASSLVKRELQVAFTLCCSSRLDYAVLSVGVHV